MDITTAYRAPRLTNGLASLKSQIAKGESQHIGIVAARGSLYLLISKISSRVAGLIGGIYLVRLLGPSSYGIFNIAVVLPGTLAIFNNLGVTDAGTRYIARLRHEGRSYDVAHYLTVGLIFNLTISVFLALIAFMGADYFSSVFLQKPFVASLTQVAAILIPAWLLLSYWQSVLLGLDRMGTFSIVLFCFELANAALPIVLLLLGLGVFGVILGMTVATLSFGALGTGLAVLYAKRGVSNTRPSEGFGATLKKLLGFGLPLSVGTLITLGGSQFIIFLMARILLPNAIGNYSAATSLAQAMTYITFPISATLFPAFSKIRADTRERDLQVLFSYSWKFSSLLLLPAATIFLVLSDSWIRALFGSQYSGAGVYLALASASWLWYGFGGAQVQRLIGAQGDTSFLARLNALVTGVSLVAGTIGLLTYGILGFLVASLPVGFLTYIIPMRFAGKKYGVRIANSQILKVYLPLLPLVLSLILIRLVLASSLLRLLTGVSIGLLVYLVSTVLLRSLDRRDISILTEITSGQPIIGPLTLPVTRFLLWLNNTFARES